MMKALQFLRLVDRHDNVLSLTSIVLMVCIARLLTVETGMADLAALISAMLAYNYKRSQSAKVQQSSDAAQTALTTATASAVSVDKLTADLKQVKADVAVRLDSMLLGRR